MFSSQFAGGLPGALAPVGPFDPLGFLKNASPNEIKRFREAEVTHGRVAMLAAVGLLVGEAVEGSSFLFDASIKGPAIDHFAQVPGPFWQSLVLCIGFAETYRALKGWKSPQDAAVRGEPYFQLRDDYYPGDIGFDPAKLKPTDPEAFDVMQTKELQNGRLAMLGVAGIVAQELTDHLGVVEHFQTVGF